MKRKICVIALVLTIVCSFFVFAACDGTWGELPGGDGLQSGDNISSGDNIPSGDGQDPSDGDGNNENEGDTEEEKDINIVLNGEDIDFAALFVTDGKGKIVGLSDYGDAKKDCVVKLDIPKKIGAENIYAIDVTCLTDMHYLKVIDIPKEIIKAEGAIDKVAFILLRCEAKSMPVGWDCEWNAVGESMVYAVGYSPVIWNCNESDVADDGEVYNLAQDGKIYALKDDKASLFYSGRGEDEELTLKDSVKYKGNTYTLNEIGFSAFTSVKNNMEHISAHYPNLKKIALPNSVKRVGVMAFLFADTLEVADLNGVENIDIMAFGGCGNLNKVVADNVKYIGVEAFMECKNLKNINIPQDIVEIGLAAFYASGIQFNEFGNGRYLGCEENPYVVFYEAKSTDITECEINEKTKIIYYNAFKDCIDMTDIDIPKSVEKIYAYAFENCKSLSRVIIPDGISSIEEYLFNGCAKLADVVIPDSVLEIKEGTFMGCESLQNIVLPKNLNSIGYSAFSRCTGLTQIEIPSGIKELGDRAFYKCSNLVSIKIPDGLVGIGDDTFFGCDSLALIEYDNGFYLGNESNPYMIFMKAKNTEIENISIHKDTKIIYSNAFMECDKLTEITIPDGVTDIMKGAFVYCSLLQKVSMPDSVKYIGDIAFSICISLTDIEIPSGVEKIGDLAFSDCISLTNIVIPESVVEMGSRVFDNCGEELKIKCEAKSKPDSWDNQWNYRLYMEFYEVEWGYKG